MDKNDVCLVNVFLIYLKKNTMRKRRDLCITLINSNHDLCLSIARDDYEKRRTKKIIRQ